MTGKKSTIGRTVLPESLRAKRLRESLGALPAANGPTPSEARAVRIALTLLANAHQENQMVVGEMLSARKWE